MFSPAASASPTPGMRTGTIGNELSPLAVIDGFLPDPEAFRQNAPKLDWQVRGDFYPGPRAEVDDRYHSFLIRVLDMVLPRVFGRAGPVQVLRCFYALATARAEELTLPQRIPHVDSYDPRQIALVHYLCGAEFGGTAFYRHSATGFETVDDARSEPFHRSLEAGFTRNGEPPAGYIGTEAAGFERIGLCPAEYNRAVLFPGNLLHCADLAGVDLPDDPLAGRLTVTAFIRFG